MPIYSGIDEAGLGPILGPFTATNTTFSAPEPLLDLLKDQQKKLFYVDDSKKVFQGKNGLEKLEINVLSFYYLLTGTVPGSLQSFIPSLKSPWYRDELILPLKVTNSQIVEKADKIGKLFLERDIKLLDIKRSAVGANNFNLLLDNWENKSIACQKIVNPLIQSTINNKTDHTLVIDKQGGRKFYKEYLESLIPGSQVKIILEENNHSHYYVDGIDIHFKAKADSTSFAVALSSMFSKYMREIAMRSFNDYWTKEIPDLKPTAGYYTDGVRFIDDLKLNGVLPEDIDILRRKK